MGSILEKNPWEYYNYLTNQKKKSLIRQIFKELSKYQD